MRNRSRFDIIANILDVTEQAVVQDCIITGCHLETNQAKQYFHVLLEVGLLNAIPKQRGRGKILYRRSKKGYQFLREYNKLQQILKGEENDKSSR